MMRCVTLAAIAALLAGCSNDAERIEELEEKIESMESQRATLAGGPTGVPTPGASASAAPGATPSASASGAVVPRPGSSMSAQADPDGNVCNDGRDRYLTLVNRGVQTIMYFYASPPAAGDWEEDVLGDEVVIEDERFRINFNTDERCTCTYDTRAVFADDSEVIRKVSVCDDHTQAYP